MVNAVDSDDDMVTEPSDFALWAHESSVVHTILGPAFYKSPKRPLGSNPAARFAGASGKSDAEEEPRPDLPEWGNTRARLKETLKYVVEEYLDGNIKGVSSSRSFIGARFALPSGVEISGRQMMRAAAKLGRPGMSGNAAMKYYGSGKVAKMMREEYLGDLYETQDWGSTKERFRNTLRYVVAEYHDGDVNSISTNVEFYRRLQLLPSGQRVSGRDLMSAAVRLEYPQLNIKDVLRKIGMSEICRIIREEYLRDLHAVQDWGSTFEKLKHTLVYVLRKYLDDDIGRVTSGVFVHSKFSLPSGQVLTGRRLLFAVARLEYPDSTAHKTFRELGRSEIARIIRVKYLSGPPEDRDWGKTFENLRETLIYVVREHLNGDVSRISSSTSFVFNRYKLRSGQSVSGNQFLYAAAKLERPDLSADAAIKELGRAKVARIIKEKYLTELFNEQDWGGTPYRYRKTLEYIVREYLDGDIRRIASNLSFFASKYALPSGRVVSGLQLMYAALHLEYPGLKSSEAIEAAGGRAAVLNIMRTKYLFSLDDTPESFIRAMRLILEDEDS